MSGYEGCEVLHRIVQECVTQNSSGLMLRQELQQITRQWMKSNPATLAIARLPRIACEAVGGNPSMAVPITASWQLVRLAAKLFDDLEDREQVNQFAVTLNAATSLIFAAQLALNELAEVSALDVAQRVSVSLNRAMLRAAAGQHADIVGTHRDGRKETPDDWLEIAEAKSGGLLAWATWAGAIVGGASDELTQKCFYTYGLHLGILLQLADDFNGIWGRYGDNDLATGCLSLPVCYARLVLTPDARDHLESLLDRAISNEKAAEAEAVSILTDSGAQAYLLTVARIHARRAAAALEQVPGGIPTNRALIALLDGVMPGLASSGVS